jgi:hypothetical protein
LDALIKRLSRFRGGPSGFRALSENKMGANQKTPEQAGEPFSELDGMRFWVVFEGWEYF